MRVEDHQRKASHHGRKRAIKAGEVIIVKGWKEGKVVKGGKAEGGQVIKGLKGLTEKFR